MRSFLLPLARLIADRRPLRQSHLLQARTMPLQGSPAGLEETGARK